MHAVHLHLHGQLDAVVEHEECLVFLAQGYQFHGGLAEFLVRGILEAQLYPAAASFEHHLHLLGYRIAVGGVGYEHQHISRVLVANRFMSSTVACHGTAPSMAAPAKPDDLTAASLSGVTPPRAITLIPAGSGPNAMPR